MPEYEPSETAVIILGDFAANYYLSKHDWKIKHHAAKFGYTIYALRGNHEQRASLIKNMEKVYDNFVHGYVYMEQEFPNIKYFVDEVAEYEIMGKKVLCIPGAYSVDKWYRLQNGWQWFAQEQLSAEEMEEGIELCSGKTYDFVLSHTCPLSWMPRDLFLPMIDQSKVDYSMENYLEGIRKIIGFEVWCFAHYHCDRLERPNAQMFFQEVESMDDIFARVTQPATAPDYKHIKSPNYYMEDN